MSFHWKDSIYFDRKPNGDIVMKKTAGGPNDPVLFEMEISGSEWCSIVAACSSAGAKATTFAAARALHFGPVK